MAKKRITTPKTTLRPRTTTRRHDVMADETYDTPEPEQVIKASETVTVKALKYHTHEGKEYHEGDSYEVDASKVDNLIAGGWAAPVA